MRSWNLHHGVPSYRFDGTFGSLNRGNRRSGDEGLTGADGRDSTRPSLSLFDPDREATAVEASQSRSVAGAGRVDGDVSATATLTAQPIRKTGRVIAGSRVGDDVAGETTLGVLLPHAEMHRCDDIPLADVVDADDCAPGDIVRYRVGQDDPVDVMAKALSRGAAAILTEQLLPCPLPQAIVGDVDMAAATIRHHQLGQPDQRQLTIAVTGSAGKTTTALWIAKLTRHLGLATAYETSLGLSDSSTQGVPTTFRHGGAELIERLNQSAEQSASVSVIEIDGTSATHGRYDSVQFDIVVCVGATPGSEDFGPAPLDSILHRLTDDGVVVVAAADDAACLAIDAAGVEKVTYGVDNADVCFDVMDDRDGLMTLMLSVGDTMHVVETPLTGSHNAANLAAAACVGRLFDRPVHEIADAIGQLRKLPGRSERFTQIGKPTVVLDAGGDCHSIANVLRQSGQQTGGTLTVVVAIEPSDENLPLIGSTIERLAGRRILTAAGDRNGFLEASHAVIDGVRRCMDCRLVCDPAEAIRFAVERSKPEDTVVVITGRRGDSPAAARTDAADWKRRIERALSPEEQAESAKNFRVVR